MRNRKRLMAVYKGDDHIVTGTAAEVAKHLGITEESAVFLTYGSCHKRNTTGNRTIAVYLDDSKLKWRQHEFLIAACELYNQEKRPLRLIETAIHAGVRVDQASSTASLRYKTLEGHGYVQKIKSEHPMYVPTVSGLEYYEDFLY